MLSLTAYWVLTVLALLGATLSVLIAHRKATPLSRLVRTINHEVAGADLPEPNEEHGSAPAIVRRRRVAIDARPMIGQPTDKGFRVYGIGQYLTHLAKAIIQQDTQTEYVLWTSAWKYDVPEWYQDFLASHSNVRGIHLGLPNRLVDPLAYHRFRFLHELVGNVDVSYDANYFSIKPGHAYSICTVHDLSFRETRFQRNRNWQEKAAWRAGLADKITTVSRASRSVILEKIPGATPENVEVIYGAADDRFSPAAGDARHQFVRERYGLPEAYFICVGEPVARKNLPNLVAGFEAIRRSRPELSLIMTGFDQGQLKALLGRDVDNVRAVGFVPDEDLPPLYRGAKALLYPSIEEGFGLPVVEAMKTGQIVVTSDTLALNEIAGGVAITTSLDEMAISSALERVLNMTPTERSSRIEGGIARSANFSWEQSATQMLRLFEEGFSVP
jgi:glycosyltransferase involved in cell wall biosynthesis